VRAAVRVIVVPPRGERLYDREEWRDVLVVVGSGSIELESQHGVRRQFERFALLVLTDRRLRRLLNPGARPAILLAISRREGGES
jgi:hypothetical protein